MYSITIAGEQRAYTLNMGALLAIAENGYSGENGEGDFGSAFVDAENGDMKAMRLVAWAGLLAPYQDTITGAIDFSLAPPLSITNLMSLEECIAATSVAAEAFIAQLPQGTIEAIEKAAEAAETARKAAESAGRPTPPREKSKA